MSRSHENFPASSPSSSDQHSFQPSEYPPRGPQPHGPRVPSTTSSDYEYGASSSPSLPRYTSTGPPPSSDYSRSASSPLNPGARGGPARGPNPGSNGGGAHPLSNEYYADSTTGIEEDPDKLRASQPGSRSNSSTRYSTAPGARRGQGGFVERAYRAWSGASVADTGLDERHVKKKRLGYLDGLKFLAALLCMNGTLFDAVLSENSYKAIQRSSPLYIVRSFNLGMVILLLLSGRSLIAPLWDAPNPSAPAAKNMDPRKPLISWPRLTRAMLVRPFRFLLPVCIVAAVQWALGGTGATSKCSQVGMDEPFWKNIRSFSGYATLVFDLFTYFETDTTAGKAFGGNLWTAAWFFQSGYAVYVTHFMLGNLSSNRYWVYGILMFFSWTTFNYFYVALAGLFIADMAAHGQTARIRKWPVSRRAILWIVLAAVALVTQWLNIVRDNLNSGMATINVQRHHEITFADTLFATALVFIVETSEVAHLIFGNVVMRTLGRLSAGVYLLAAPVVYTIVPSVALSMHESGSSASTILGISWLVMFAAVLGLSIPFHFLIECPSKLLGEYFADLMENFGAEKVKPAVAAAGTHRIVGGSGQPAGNVATNKEAIGQAVQNAGK